MFLMSKQKQHNKLRINILEVFYYSKISFHLVSVIPEDRIGSLILNKSVCLMQNLVMLNFIWDKLIAEIESGTDSPLKYENSKTMVRFHDIDTFIIHDRAILGNWNCRLKN